MDNVAAAEPQAVQVPITILNKKEKTRQSMYNVISKVYYLPSFTSRAITLEYLRECQKKPCAVFRIHRNQFHPPFVASRRASATELLSAIEKILLATRQPSTGLEIDKLPDYDWLLGVYFHLAPNDELGLFTKTKRVTLQFFRMIDPEYASRFVSILERLGENAKNLPPPSPHLNKFLKHYCCSRYLPFILERIAQLLDQEEEGTTRRRGRNIYKLDDREKAEIEEVKATAKVKRREEAKKKAEAKVMALGTKIEKINTKLDQARREKQEIQERVVNSLQGLNMEEEIVEEEEEEKRQEPRKVVHQKPIRDVWAASMQQQPQDLDYQTLMQIEEENQGYSQEEEVIQMNPAA